MNYCDLVFGYIMFGAIILIIGCPIISILNDQNKKRKCYIAFLSIK